MSTGTPKTKPTNPPDIEPIKANTAAFQELARSPRIKIIPTKGEPMKNTWPTPARTVFIVPEIMSDIINK